ncbi:MAG: hypothetical protein H0V18_18995 [Pyrinomonadaceae bacterium]|nr:hypothetical protein [Pyrinomonadaceae bacterium]
MFIDTAANLRLELWRSEMFAARVSRISNIPLRANTKKHAIYKYYVPPGLPGILESSTIEKEH